MSRLDRLIADSEHAFLEFEMSVRMGMAKLPLPIYLSATDLLQPFNFVRDNVSNVHKNMIRLRTALSMYMVDLGHIRTILGNFQYDYLEPDIPPKAIATFDPISRTYFMREYLDPQLFSSKLVKYHEIVHAIQNVRSQMNIGCQEEMDEYLQLYSGDNIVVEEEAEAYGYELEVLNILLGGRLAAGEDVTAENAMEILRAGTEQDHILLRDLLFLAKQYYPQGMANNTFNRDFWVWMAQIHGDAGYNLYSLRQGKKVLILQSKKEQ